jgi:excisionase family DNA binding protein
MDKEILEKLNIIEHLLKEQALYNKPILTSEEVSIYLNINLNTIYKLTAKNSIPYYKPNGKRIYFKKDEIIEWILKNKFLSNEEIDEQASKYLSNRRIKR